MISFLNISLLISLFSISSQYFLATLEPKLAKYIFLSIYFPFNVHADAVKIGNNHKADVSCNCESRVPPQSRRKCRKNKVECLEYYHNSRRNYGKPEFLKAITDVKIFHEVRKEVKAKYIGRTGFKASDLKVKKRARTLALSNRKRDKITRGASAKQNAESETKMQPVFW